MKKRKTEELKELDNYQFPDKFGKLLGYEVLDVDWDRHVVKVGLTIREDHLSPAGRVHGGVISGLFDFSCGAATFSSMDKGDFCSTVELKVNYFKPLNNGDDLYTETRVVFKGKRLRVLESFLYRKNEEDPVAMATSTFNVVSKKNKN